MPSAAVTSRTWVGWLRGEPDPEQIKKAKEEVFAKAKALTEFSFKKIPHPEFMSLWDTFSAQYEKLWEIYRNPAGTPTQMLEVYESLHGIWLQLDDLKVQFDNDPELKRLEAQRAAEPDANKRKPLTEQIHQRRATLTEQWARTIPDEIRVRCGLEPSRADVSRFTGIGVGQQAMEAVTPKGNALFTPRELPPPPTRPTENVTPLAPATPIPESSASPWRVPLDHWYGTLAWMEFMLSTPDGMGNIEMMQQVDDIRERLLQLSRENPNEITTEMKFLNIRLHSLYVQLGWATTNTTTILNWRKDFSEQLRAPLSEFVRINVVLNHSSLSADERAMLMEHASFLHNKITYRSMFEPKVYPNRTEIAMNRLTPAEALLMKKWGELEQVKHPPLSLLIDDTTEDILRRMRAGAHIDWAPPPAQPQPPAPRATAPTAAVKPPAPEARPIQEPPRAEARPAFSHETYRMQVITTLMADETMRTTWPDETARRTCIETYLNGIREVELKWADRPEKVGAYLKQMKNKAGSDMERLIYERIITERTAARTGRVGR